MKCCLPKWMHLKNYRIEHKLLLTYPIIIVVSISVVSIFSIYLIMAFYKEKSIDYSQQLMKQVSTNIDNQLMRIDQDTYIFIQDQDIRRFFLSEDGRRDAEYYQLRIKIQGFLTNFLLSHPNIESIYLINAHGDFISTSDGLKTEQIPYYLDQAKNGDGRLMWLKAQTGPNGNVMIPAVRQINDLSTLHPNGTLLLNLKQNSINHVLIDDDVRLKGSVLILDDKGYVVSSTDQHQVGQHAEDPLWPMVTEQTAGFFYSGDQNQQLFYNFYKSGFTNWTYLYVLSSFELFKGIDAIRNWMLGVAVIFTIIGVIASRLIARNISRPIDRVIREMKSIEANHLLVNLHYEGKDELTSLTHSFNHMMGQLREYMQKEKDLIRLQHELEMRALQAEINPHFLYNTLEAINWMGRINQVPEICDATSKLADIMRYSIDSKRDMVSVGDEFMHVQKYLDILQFRLKDNLSVFVEAADEIKHSPIPKLTLQPVVENAILHGLENKIGKGVIRIIGQMSNNRVVIKIEDNGCGMDEFKKQRLLDCSCTSTRKGIGLLNVHQRIQLFFGNAYGLEIISVLGKGTRVLISLPLVKEGDKIVQSVDC